MKVFWIKDWDSHYENYKSREQDSCRYVCVPNKQGVGFCHVITQDDGPSIYGIWILILAKCSTQRRPRIGLLTHDGTVSGRPLTAFDLAMTFRRTEKEVARAIEVLSSNLVDWILVCEIGDLIDTPQFKRSILSISAQYPDDTPEQKERRERREEKYSAIPDSLNTPEFQREWGAWLTHRMKKRKPVSPEAARRQLLTLSKFGTAVALEAINQSIQNEWQGLFPEKIRINGTSKTPKPNDRNFGISANEINTGADYAAIAKRTRTTPTNPVAEKVVELRVLPPVDSGDGK